MIGYVFMRDNRPIESHGDYEDAIKIPKGLKQITFIGVAFVPEATITNECIYQLKPYKPAHFMEEEPKIVTEFVNPKCCGEEFWELDMLQIISQNWTRTY